MINSLRLAFLIGAIVLGGLGMSTYVDNGPPAQTVNRDLYLKQLADDDAVPRQIDREYAHRQNEARSLMLLSGAAGLVLAGTLGLNFVTRRAQQRQGLAGGVAPAKPARSPEL